MVSDLRLLAVPACLVAAARCAGWARRARASGGGGAGRRARARRPVAFLGTVVVVIAAVAGGPAPTVLLVAALGAACIVRWAHRLADPARYEQALQAVVEALAAQLRSGASLHQALITVADTCTDPVRADLDRLVADVGAGAGLSEALRSWSDRRPIPVVRLVTGTLAVGSESGGLRARIVDELADALRRRAHARAEAGALAGQARASAAVMTATPLVLAAALAASDRSAARFLTESTAGVGCLAVGLALDLVGAAWMTRITAVLR